MLRYRSVSLGWIRYSKRSFRFFALDLGTGDGVFSLHGQELIYYYFSSIFLLLSQYLQHPYQYQNHRERISSFPVSNMPSSMHEGPWRSPVSSPWRYMWSISPSGGFENRPSCSSIMILTIVSAECRKSSVAAGILETTF